MREADEYQLPLLHHMANNRPLVMPFRISELHEYQALTTTVWQTVTVKTSSDLKNPWYVVLLFQTAQKKDITKNASEVDI